jgi:MerR family copper efflux transcriptional regulator
MRITEAAQRLGISARMLRYRESLGLLPVVRTAGSGSVASGASGGSGGSGVRHRQFGPAEMDAVALGLAIEQRYDISPAALAFGLRVLADPAARAHVTELGRQIGRVRPLPAMAMDFEKERAQRLLNTAVSSARRPGTAGIARR